MIPYGRQSIDGDDIKAVVEILNSDYLTTGPAVDRFEEAVTGFCSAEYGVAVANGTAALHAAVFAAGIADGDEVITTPMTFAATSNAVLFQRGQVVFADVDESTLLIDPDKVEQKITQKTKAVIAVDYAGQPCDYKRLREIADRHELILISDACHSIGGFCDGKPVGSLADITCFSFHPVKHITTGEGGMVVTDNKEFADRARIFRNHGITTDHRQRMENGAWFYEMTELGYNYRITDIQCALGISQLKKLPGWIERRNRIAERYDREFRNIPEIEPLGQKDNILNAYHLYVINLSEKLDRNQIFSELRAGGIGVNVHYIPVHLHPYYTRELNTSRGLCPVAEKVYENIISLPVYPALTDEQQTEVIEKVKAAVS